MPARSVIFAAVFLCSLFSSPTAHQLVAGPRIQYFSATMPSFSKEVDKWQTADTLYYQCSTEMSARGWARQKLCKWLGCILVSFENQS